MLLMPSGAGKGSLINYLLTHIRELALRIERPKREEYIALRRKKNQEKQEKREMKQQAEDADFIDDESSEVTDDTHSEVDSEAFSIACRALIQKINPLEGEALTEEEECQLLEKLKVGKDFCPAKLAYEK
jgi:hypothetical protein